MKTRSHKSKNWLIWPIVILAFFAFSFFSYKTAAEIKKKRKIEKEINELREQAEKIEKENKSLQDRIAYLNSSDYQKIQAKDKLSLQSPDENVVMIASGPIKKEVEKNSLPASPAAASQQLSNFKKWLNYFINK